MSDSSKKEKSNRTKLIGTLIAALGLFLMLFLKDCFGKPEMVGGDTNITANDSSTQFVQSGQDNSGVERVENIFGNKYEYEQPETKPSILPKNHSNAQKTKPEQQPTGPNYGNQNFAPVGRDLIQTINPPTDPPRHLTKEQTNEILSSIPEGYTVEIRFPYPDQESGYFYEQIERLLSKSGRTSFGIYSDIGPNAEKSFKIEPYPDKPNTVILTIYRQK